MIQTRLLALVVSSLLTGCATIELSNVALEPVAHVQVDDLRSPESKAPRRDASSAIIFLEDDRFKPRVLDLYVTEIAKAVGPHRALRLEVQEFRMVDFMGERGGSSGMGVIGALLAETAKNRATDWAFVDELKLDRRRDAIICLLVVKLNGQWAKVAVSEPYRLSPLGVLAFNDPDFRRALNLVIQRAAAKTLDEAKLAAR